jgi:membrane protein implicated in regulation of membrane protease activity
MLSDISGSWLWLIAGLILCGLEMFAPGVFLLWFGLAAIATGLTLFLAPLNGAWTLLLFAVFAVAAVALGRKFYGARDEAPSGARLNSRSEALVGRVFVLETAIVDGEGAARVQDSIWRVVGPDLPAGARVRVTGVDGGVRLKVEPASG